MKVLISAVASFSFTTAILHITGVKGLIDVVVLTSILVLGYIIFYIIGIWSTKP